MASALAEPPSTVTVYPSGSRPEPVVLADAVRFPVGVAHVTVNVVVAVPPDGTLTVREVPPLTEQLPATPEIATVWLPAANPVYEALPLIASACGEPPSTVTVYPSGSRFEPLVL